MQFFRNSMVKKVFLIYLFGYLSAPIGYLIRILYAREFSVGEFGLIYSIIGVIGFISIFNDFGFTETLNYYVTRFYEKMEYSKVKGTLYFAFLMQGITALFLGGLFFFLSPYLAQNYFKSDIAVNTFRWFLLYLFFVNVSKPFVSLFVALQRYQYNNFGEFLRNFLTLALSALIIFVPQLKIPGFVGFVWGFSYFVLFFSFYIMSRVKFPKIYHVKADLSFGLYKKLFSYAIYLILGSGAVFLLSRVDIMFLTYYKDLEQVGLYSAALSLATILSTLVGPAIGVIFPLTSKLNVENKIDKIKEIITGTYNLGLYLSVPFLIVFVIFPQEIISLFLGWKYVAAKSALIILSMAYFVSLLYGFNNSIAAGLGLIKKRTKIMYVGAFVNVVGNILFIPKWGIIGAAASTFLSMVTLYFLTFTLVKRNVEFQLSKSHLLKIFASNIIIFALMFFLKRIISANIFIEAGIIGVVCGAVYVALGYFWKIVDYKRVIDIFKNR